MGQMVGHVIADLDERFTFFSEVSVTGRDNGYSIEVERALVRYDFSDAFKISVGRFHTPVGYWNAAFHHGSWLQTSVARPEMIKFGSRFIPTHFVGLIAEGGMPASPLRLGYSLGVGNGRAANIARAGTPATSTTHVHGWRGCGRGPSRSPAWSSARASTATDFWHPTGAMPTNGSTPYTRRWTGTLARSWPNTPT